MIFDFYFADVSAVRACREPGKHRGQRADSGRRRGDLRVGAARPEVARVRGRPSLGAARSRRTPLSSSARERSQAGLTDLADAGSSGRLLPILGVGFGLAVTIGNAIGAGILRAPGEVAGHLPVVWLYMAVWVVGGLYALARRAAARRARRDDSALGRPVRVLTLRARRVPRLHRRLERLDLDLRHDGGGLDRHRRVLGRAVSAVGRPCRGDRHGGRRRLRRSRSGAAYGGAVPFRT